MCVGQEQVACEEGRDPEKDISSKISAQDKDTKEMVLHPFLHHFHVLQRTPQYVKEGVSQDNLGA